MGIDPGTNITGYGVIEVRGREVRCIVVGCIELKGYKDAYGKLRHIFERVSAVVAEY
ncbi:MAG: crossover junction endodeoxyribonuclease RuvC, partial [Rikenellaceae bacterium]|nr:crossover junction endodeoxyribonuclease RuvC [Rikenellaceae bacterium]